MLVIVSDLHLTDGTSGETVHDGAFRMFRERLRETALNASWRADGKYKPIQSGDIVLLGDVLDLIQSARWLEEKPGHPGYVRPWSNSGQEPFVKKIRTITQSILDKNAGALEILRSLKDPEEMSLPLRAREGTPSRAGMVPEASERVPILVRLHYMVGNRDWFYHLSDSAYNDARRAVAGALAIENPPDQPFPYDPKEPAADAINHVFLEHKVFARHGDRFDLFNYDGHRSRSSLGDAMAIDLIETFISEVKAQLGQFLPAEFVEALKEIHNVRPLLMLPVWLDGLLRAACPERTVQKRVRDLWDELVEMPVHLPFVRDHKGTFHLFEDMDRLRLALTFSKRAFRDHLSRFSPWFDEKFGTYQGSYYPHALHEAAFKCEAARFIVYGHTHCAQTVPLDTLMRFAGGPAKRLYINAGTWRPVQQFTRLDVGEKFMGYHSLTYTAFFKDDERGGRSFETWTGALGMNSQDHQF